MTQLYLWQISKLLEASAPDTDTRTFRPKLVDGCRVTTFPVGDIHDIIALYECTWLTQGTASATTASTNDKVLLTHCTMALYTFGIAGVAVHNFLIL